MFNERWIKRSKISAIHDHQLETYLASLGVLSEISDGRKHCKVCESQISLENIGAIVPVAGRIEIFCDRAKCLAQLNTTGVSNE